MKARDLLPASTRGLLELFCFHPFWHEKYRRDFGMSVVILCAVFQVALFAILAAGRDQVVWPLIGVLSFLGGSLVALFVCAEISIVQLHFSGQRRCLGSLILVQLVASALIVGALFIAPVRGSLASVADGVLLYPFTVGILMFVVAPLGIWETERR
jgi:hypothetical protein